MVITRDFTKISLAFEYAAEKLGFVLLTTVSLLVVILKNVIKHQFQHPLCFL